MAGRDVTEHMQTLLRRAGYVFHTSAEKEIVRHLKESTGYVALDPSKEEKEWAGQQRTEAKSIWYTLPDGQKIKIGSERFRAPEILFNPELIGLEYQGVHHMVVDAIQRTDMDLRKNLFGSIVLSGGSTLTKGFGDRLLHEVQRLAVKDMKIKIFAPPDRKYRTWIGGGILAGLSTFKKVKLPSRATRPPLLTCRRCGSKRRNGWRTQTSFTQNFHDREPCSSNALRGRRYPYLFAVFEA